jgi:hypothetical protein
MDLGHAIAQAVSRRRSVFEPRSGRVGFMVEKVALGEVFSEYFGFPSQFSFHQLLHTHLSSEAGTIGELVADVPSAFSLTPPQVTKRNLLCISMLFKTILIHDHVYSAIQILQRNSRTWTWSNNGHTRAARKYCGTIKVFIYLIRLWCKGVRSCDIKLY